MARRFQFAMPDPRPRDGWFRAGTLDVTTTALLVLGGVASMFVFAVNRAWFDRLVFFAPLVREGDLWRLVTWPFANAPDRIWVVLTLVFFWFIGHAVEELIGRVRYATLVAIVAIVPAAIVTALPYASFPTYPAIGLSLLGTAMLAVFAAEHPHAPFLFGVPAWVITCVFIGIDVLRLVGERAWGSLIQLLAMVALALVIVRQWGFAERLDMIPRLTGPRRPHPPRRGPAPPRRTDRRPARTQASVIEGPWTAPPSRDEAAAAQAELDELLDKISASGLDSLTSDEKRRLNELSKRLR